MARVGLIDLGGRIPNLALIKLSAWYKGKGDTVHFGDFLPRQVDKTYVSVIFTKNRAKAERLRDLYPDVTFGGTGWDTKTELPAEIETMCPDYTLYTVEEIYKRINNGIGTRAGKIEKTRILTEAAIGHSSRGCVRSCGFCLVPAKEGPLRQVGSIGELVRPGSPYLILLDNNLTADPDCLEKLREIRERNLYVDISQGIDARLITPEIAEALSNVRHIRSLHTAWDFPSAERQVMNGIELLKRFIPARKLMAFMLVGYSTSPEEDDYRFQKLCEVKVDPYVMKYAGPDRKTIGDTMVDLRLKHFARWVNARVYKVCPKFEDYEPWIKARRSVPTALDAPLVGFATRERIAEQMYRA